MGVQPEGCVQVVRADEETRGEYVCYVCERVMEHLFGLQEKQDPGLFVELIFSSRLRDVKSRVEVI